VGHLRKEVVRNVGGANLVVQAVEQPPVILRIGNQKGWERESKKKKKKLESL
jgi:hypothetical protein